MEPLTKIEIKKNTKLLKSIIPKPKLESHNIESESTQITSGNLNNQWAKYEKPKWNRVPLDLMSKCSSFPSIPTTSTHINLESPSKNKEKVRLRKKIIVLGIFGLIPFCL